MYNCYKYRPTEYWCDTQNPATICSLHHHATGDAITMETVTSFKKSFDKKCYNILLHLHLRLCAHRFLLCAVLCTECGETKQPKHEIRIAMMVKVIQQLQTNDFPLHNFFENLHPENCIQKVHLDLSLCQLV